MHAYFEGLCSLQIVMRILMDKGDAILCEEYTYPHVSESMVQPQGYIAVPLTMDSTGIVPSLFRETMESLRAAGKPLPRLLYTVPVGQNPTGVSPHSLPNLLWCFLGNLSNESVTAWVHMQSRSNELSSALDCAGMQILPGKIMLQQYSAREI